MTSICEVLNTIFDFIATTSHVNFERNMSQMLYRFLVDNKKCGSNDQMMAIDILKRKD